VPSNSYDLVVLGDDLAALVCATLCARRGMRTLVLGDERPARYQLGPHKLPVEPASWPTQPGAGGERVLKELHAELSLRRKLREPKLSAQLVGPDFRIDLGTDRLATELERELGRADAKASLALWEASAEVSRLFDPMLSGEHAFPAVAFFERREVNKLAEKLEADSSAWWKQTETTKGTTLWKHLAAIALRHPTASPAAIARAVDVWRTGPSSLRGDGDAIREILVEKLTTAGGEVRAGKVTEIGVSWGKISSVTLSNGDELGAGQVVSSRTPQELAELLGKKAPKRLAELAETIQLVGYRYTLNVVLDEAGIPEHMAPTVAVVTDPSQEPVGDTAFSIHLGDTDDAGRIVATIAAILPSQGAIEPGKLGSRMSAMRAGLWKALGEVMPFFERHLVLAHSPFEATPPHVPGGRGSYDVPRSLPLPMSPIWKGTHPQMLAHTAGTGALPYMTGLKNLTLTGDQVLPGLGIEGALVAGWSAAKVACAIAGKKKDYLRDEVVGSAAS
jgi:phytoene dehydrogenase-like protein